MTLFGKILHEKHDLRQKWFLRRNKMIKEDPENGGLGGLAKLEKPFGCTTQMTKRLHKRGLKTRQASQSDSGQRPH